MAEVVGIKFKHSGKVYYFAPCKMKLSKGDGVIVETARGVEYGKVVSEPRDVSEDKIVQPLKPIVRRATADDEARVKKNEAKVADAMKVANEKIAQRGLKMKLIGAEFSFEGGKVVFYFTAAGRIDFRELVKDLASAFHIRIELRQVGHQGRNENSRRNRSVRKSLLLRELYAGLQKSNYKNGENAGFIA